MKKIPVGLLSIGVLLGCFVVLVVESRAPSYLSNDSTACANCHVMLSSFNTWSQSSHRNNAQCNDCHIPHENMVRRYVAKGLDGARHAFVFTTRTYPQVIRATETAKSTIQRNCIRCHEPMLKDSPAHNANLLHEGAIERTCWSCHREVPHGRSNSIATFPGTATMGWVASDFISNRERKK